MEAIDYCPVCYQVHGQAYNGILQLRNPSKELIELVDKQIESAHEKRAYCIKIMELKNGVDYFFSSASFTKHLGKFLQQRFGGEYKETARLVTRSNETSKDLYRLTILFRVPDFKKGDIVDYKGREVKVLNFGPKVFIQDIKTSKKQQARYEDIRP